MLTKETVEKISNLAHIELKEDKKEKIRKDISNVLDYIEKLKEVDTSQVDFKAISPVVNQIREDKAKDTKEEEKEKMRSMGKNKDNYFQVESI